MALTPESRRFLLSAATGSVLFGFVGAGCAVVQKDAQPAGLAFAIRAVDEAPNVAGEKARKDCATAAKAASDLLVCYDAARKSAPPAPPDEDRVPHGKPVAFVQPPFLYLKREGEVTKDMVAEAHGSINEQDGKPVVTFSLTKAGAERFAALTRANIGRHIAVVVSGAVVSEPVVRSEISGGRGMIGDQGTMADACALAAAIKPPKDPCAAPSAGTEASLRRFIEAEQRGDPDYEDMTPAFAAFERNRSSIEAPAIRNLGPLKSLTFRDVDIQGLSRFQATFEKANANFGIGPLTPDGKVRFITWTAAPTPAQEEAIKQYVAAGKPDPERKAILLEHITGEQSGDPKPEIRSPIQVAVEAEMWPAIQEMHKRLGKFKSLEFRGINPRRGWDGYEAIYENGRVDYLIGPLTSDHKISGLSVDPTDPALTKLMQQAFEPYTARHFLGSSR